MQCAAEQKYCAGVLGQLRSLEGTLQGRRNSPWRRATMGVPNHFRGRRKVPTMSQVFCSIQNIYFRKTCFEHGDCKAADVLECQGLFLKWICYQISLCPWFLKNILLSLNIFRRPWKFFNSFQSVHFWIIDWIEHSRIKYKQCKWTEQYVDLFHLQLLFKNGCALIIRFV